MQRSKSFDSEEESKLNPYFSVDREKPIFPSFKRGDPIFPIEACNDYVVIVRDKMSSTIQVSDNVMMPTGIIVGTNPDSKIHIGDHVRFTDAMAVSKDASYPDYDGISLVVVAEKYVLFKLP